MLFLGFLPTDGLEIAHALDVYKGSITHELEESMDFIAHIIQLVALGILIYIAVLFRNFAKELEESRKLKEE